MLISFSLLIERQFQIISVKIKESVERIFVPLNEKINDVENSLLALSESMIL